MYEASGRDKGQGVMWGGDSLKESAVKQILLASGQCYEGEMQLVETWGGDSRWQRSMIGI